MSITKIVKGDAQWDNSVWNVRNVTLSMLPQLQIMREEQSIIQILILKLPWKWTMQVQEDYNVVIVENYMSFRINITDELKRSGDKYE